VQPILGAAVAAAAAGAVEAAELDCNGTRSCRRASYPLVADRRNFFKVELWADDGLHICRPHRNL
jgi:hypothetical protein